MIKWFKRKDRRAREVQEEVQEHKDQQPEEVPEEPEAEEPSEGMDKGEAAPYGAEAAAEAEDDFREGDDDGLAAEPYEADETELEDVEEPHKEKGRFFKRLRERLHKTREQFVDRMDRLVLGKKTIDADLMDDLEEVLITSDLGVKTSRVLLQRVADKIKRQELKDPSKLREALREDIKAILAVDVPPLDVGAHHPFVIMVIGVNGVGKTTTIGKLAHQMKGEGRKVMLVAADTFRAAAVEQLSLWADRAGVPIVKQKSGSDPSAVAFDAIDAAVSREMDVVLLDTAGRMHTKVNLMEELKKVQRTVSRKMPDAPHEILLVLDATTGQNALSQAKLFKEQIGATGLILTKLDGTAKGGIIVAICEELKLPVRYIGIGESMDDLRPFDAEEFTRALF